jgi:hypothetical protein
MSLLVPLAWKAAEQKNCSGSSHTVLFQMFIHSTSDRALCDLGQLS